jgi:Rha family phage regulatory protein
MKKIDKTKAIIACNQETMTSLEVAELTGMRHADLLRDIRKMEVAWDKINQRKFALVEYTDSKGEKRPMYQLNKKEWLYIATKFNDEARVMLINRWEYLEEERRKFIIEREVGKLVRRTLTDALQESGENERMHGFAYSTYTNKIYKSLFGMNAKQIREYLKLDKNANLREYISSLAIKRISALENIAQHLVEMGCQYQMICEEIDNIITKQNIGINLQQLVTK